MSSSYGRIIQRVVIKSPLCISSASLNANNKGEDKIPSRDVWTQQASNRKNIAHITRQLVWNWRPLIRDQETHSAQPTYYNSGNFITTLDTIQPYYENTTPISMGHFIILPQISAHTIFYKVTFVNFWYFHLPFLPDSLKMLQLCRNMVQMQYNGSGYPSLSLYS